MESQTEKLAILFHSNNEILKVINSGISLEKIFGLPNEKCDLLNSHILSTENSDQFIITRSQNKEEKLYQVKKGDVHIKYVTTNRKGLHKILKTMNMQWNDIK